MISTVEREIRTFRGALLAVLRKIGLSIIIGGLALTVLLGCGSSAASRVASKGEVHSVHWSVSREIGLRTIVLGFAATYCEFTSSEKPRVQQVERVEKRRSAVITVFVHFPPRSKPKELEGCPGAELLLRSELR